MFVKGTFLICADTNLPPPRTSPLGKPLEVKCILKTDVVFFVKMKWVLKSA